MPTINRIWHSIIIHWRSLVSCLFFCNAHLGFLEFGTQLTSFFLLPRIVHFSSVVVVVVTIVVSIFVNFFQQIKIFGIFFKKCVSVYMFIFKVSSFPFFSHTNSIFQHLNYTKMGISKQCFPSFSRLLEEFFNWARI